MADKAPQDTDTCVYYPLGRWSDESISLRELIDFLKEKFPRAHFDDIQIGHDRYKARGCGCCYDASDYDNYLECRWYERSPEQRESDNEA